jgi:oligopeptide/dipeptide ABC transporter ATP-binding protein
MNPLLTVQDLTVAFPNGKDWVPVVRGLGLQVDCGDFIGLVGESGSGKSLTALALLRLIPPPGRITSGVVRFEGRDLLTCGRKEIRQVRGGGIGIVFQEPMIALNPVFTIGFQISEAVRSHQKISAKEAKVEAQMLLDLVAIPAAAKRLKDYPHQLSGGQRQRVMIAMALAGKPKLLIADEPTTALDVTIQAQILDLLDHLKRELNLAVLLISHDLGVVAESCDRVLVMYGGQIVEEAEARTLFSDPRHPYSKGLLSVVPHLGRRVPKGILPTIPGQVPEPTRLPSGCSFHPRCSEYMEICSTQDPQLDDLENGSRARCLLYSEAS